MYIHDSKVIGSTVTVLCSYLSLQVGGGNGCRVACISPWQVLVLCPAHAHLPARNGLVNEVEFLGLIT